MTSRGAAEVRLRTETRWALSAMSALNPTQGTRASRAAAHAISSSDWLASTGK